MTLPARSKNHIGKVEAISALISVVVVSLAIILLIGGNERITENDEKVSKAINDMDRIVNRAIEYCSDKHDFECDEIMIQWFEECKKPIMDKITSCNDERIANYLKNNDMT